MSDFEVIGVALQRVVIRAAEAAGRDDWAARCQVAFGGQKATVRPPQWMENLAESVRDHIDPVVGE